ncbi:MAG: hypothetical protein IJD49_06760 [Clostridia bacterium]|nr:hypothetical protein [Clostridia bacterium]
MKTKKLLSILLSVLMLTGIFSVGASAADELNNTDIMVVGTVIDGTEESWWLTVNGALTADGASASNYNIRITPATTTSAAKVTLKNAQLNQTALFNEYHYAGIVSDMALDIELQGTNKFDITHEDYGYAYGIVSNNALKIYGNGTLVMNLGNENTVISSGINGNTVDISGKAAIALNLNSIYQINGGYSLYSTTLSDEASLEINENFIVNKEAEEEFAGTEFAEGINATGYQITYDGLKLSDKAKISVKASNPDSAPNINIGMEIKGNIELSGDSHINIIAVDGVNSAGISMNNGGISVSGNSTITAKAGNGSNLAYGIHQYDGNSKDFSTVLSDNAKITATAGDAKECAGIYSARNLVLTGKASVTGTAGKATALSYGVYFWGAAEIGDNTSLTGKADGAAEESCGVFFGNSASIGGNAAIEAYSGNSDGKTRGLLANKDLTVSDNAEINAESENSKNAGSCGLECKEFKAYGNAVINAKSGEAVSASGALYTKNATVYGSAKINAVADKAYQNSFGFGAEGVATITENSQVTAKSGKAYASYGIFGFDNAAHSLTVSGNASVTAEAAEGTNRSLGIFMPSISISGNAKVTATAGDSEEFSFGLSCLDATIRNAATVEAKGSNSALYMNDFYEITGYADVYIAISTDTNAENAVEWDYETLLAAYEHQETLHESPYKYVYIASEAPEEPEPELSFFEQLIADITAFFNSIIEFFTSLFSFLG